MFLANHIILARCGLITFLPWKNGGWVLIWWSHVSFLAASSSIVHFLSWLIHKNATQLLLIHYLDKGVEDSARLDERSPTKDRKIFPLLLKKQEEKNKGGHLDFILCAGRAKYFILRWEEGISSFSVCWCWQMCCRLREHPRTVTISTWIFISVSFVLMQVHTTHSVSRLLLKLTFPKRSSQKKTVLAELPRWSVLLQLAFYVIFYVRLCNIVFDNNRFLVRPALN